jgi:hypothetical protein
MIITKKITGTIENFSSFREFYLDGNHDFFWDDWDDSYGDYDYRHYYKPSYFVQYQNLLISYEINGIKKLLYFDTAFLSHVYARNDSIVLLYNKIHRSVKIP